MKLNEKMNYETTEGIFICWDLENSVLKIRHFGIRNLGNFISSVEENELSGS
jgi:hypothetical protein